MNDNRKYGSHTELTVREPALLIDFLSKVKDGASRNKIKGILSGGGVLVDGKPVSQYNFQLRPGMKVAISRGKNTSAGTDRPDSMIRIVYEVRYLVVVDKQPGILSMATPHHPFSIKTLLDDYFHKSRQRCTAHVVHRLDRDTSGLMLYAKSMECRLRFEEDWKTTVYDRRYVALVEGRVNPPTGTVESWLKDDKQFFTHSYPEEIPGSKYAITHYRTLAQGRGRTLLELKLDTGRKNQIRVHLSGLGHPIVGDPKYGSEEQLMRIEESQNPADNRLCLHACRLCFIHPYTGKKLEFNTSVPAEFEMGL